MSLPKKGVMARFSDILKKIYEDHKTLFKLFGSIVIFCGVAFELWQVLEARK
jgi:hypothetical protein